MTLLFIQDSLVSESDKCNNDNNDEPTMDQNQYLPYEDQQQPTMILSEGESSFSSNKLFTEYL